MTFEELKLNNFLRNAIEDLEYVNVTPIQKEAFPVIGSGKDIIGIAQTGTGKTMAYLLPILQNLKFSNQDDPRVLIVVPTRELVAQVVEEIEALTKYMSVRTVGVYGGANINTQKQKVHEGLDILVGTPGRVLDIALAGVLKFKSLQKFVIDEVDEMLDLGFRPQLTRIMDLLPHRRQNIMFSATITDDVQELINTFFSKPEKVEIARTGTPADKVTQRAYHVPNFYTKVNMLEYLLDHEEDMEKVLVFVRNKKLADRLHEHVEKKFPEQTGIIHSNKSQNYRFRMLESFENGTFKFLIATDIIARGLDIKGITHVINFDTPEVPEEYIHRIGRTGRADEKGLAITFINEAEQLYQMQIEELMGKAIPLEPMPEEVKISDIFSEEEKPKISDRDYLQDIRPKRSSGGGAFHTKQGINNPENQTKKVHRGPKKTKPVNRGRLKRKFRKK
ncbi:DEAD/DEAH box helicase [Flammeovirga yaeyamensis]|uniref:DEAD/DEAH box helicase n=1 Tax=Flammeovirga yaeyamensis TaxID=367791 RepID=A0AAX1N6Q8_9BACT|nr:MULTISPECIES: DEAD/DEAH box helicase [Flammeovirga]ANQ49407.1 DEAD/DEAH box helicase [Flammeovirga sp. MY04]MBB3697707.1 ATP-dependent RNA helicase RhlE [Flammeovirga yaeyamensis]NMF35934.1 DEAD/DEAH box helicase [Flammeovirga yaeyamensis]QWG03117.1 DEAD/DEAH box helicase [Flammeovirga yaeyamensis]